MKWFKRSGKQFRKPKSSPGYGKRISLRKQDKSAGWRELSYQEAISYWTKSQGMR